MRPLVVKHGGLTKRETRSINNYFNELNKYHVLTPEEENELAFRVSQYGDKEARDKLIKHNLRFVVSVAKQYETVNNKVEDLINEGNIGLIKAAETFDPTRGFKFISYAVWHIRQKIMAYLKDSNIMRIPVNKSTNASKIKKLLAQHLIENDNIPMGLDEETDFLLKEGFSHADIIFYRRLHTVRPSSLDAPLSADDSNSNDLTSVLEDPDSENPTHGLLHNSQVENNKELMFKSLSAIESFIIEREFGLNGYEAQRSNDIGKELNISGERVRQIRIKALRKLRRQLQGQAKWMVSS